MKFFQHGSQRWHHQHPLQHGGVSVHLYDFYFDPLWSRVKQISIILRCTRTNSQSSPWCCPGTTRAQSAPWAAGAPPPREAAWLASSRRWTWSWWSEWSCWWLCYGDHDLNNLGSQVDVPVVSDEHCRDSYGQSDITDSMICAGNLKHEIFPPNQTNKLLSKTKQISGSKI